MKTALSLLLLLSTNSALALPVLPSHRCISVKEQIEFEIYPTILASVDGDFLGVIGYLDVNFNYPDQGTERARFTFDHSAPDEGSNRKTGVSAKVITMGGKLMAEFIIPKMGTLPKDFSMTTINSDLVCDKEAKNLKLN